MSNPAQDSQYQPGTSPTNEKDEDSIYAYSDYSAAANNWFTAKPYGFRFTAKGKKPLIMFLPISPSNLTITTSFATNIVSTLYGIVEEHSPVRFYDIQIEGTTGMAPKYVNPVSDAGLPAAKKGRSTFSVQQTIGSQILGGFLSQTINRANNVINDTKALFGQSDEMVSGLYVDQTGYMAFHNLYRYLLKYKKDASGVDPTTKGVKRAEDDQKNPVHPLVFFNYKDCNQYNVVIKNFTLRRDKEDPMLYNYSITMRGYALSDINDPTGGVGSKTDKDMLVDLGLNGVDGSTYLGRAKQVAVQGKSILGTIGTGINLFGR